MAEHYPIESLELAIYNKMKLTNLLVQMVYPTILTYFMNRGTEDTHTHLRNITAKAAKGYLTLDIPKGNTLKKVVTNTMKLWGNKYKVKTESDAITITTKKCPICTDMPKIEIEGIKYCIFVGYYLEAVLNEIKEFKTSEEITKNKFRADTPNSKGSGDDICEIKVTWTRED